MGDLKLGDGTQDGVNIGPLINEGAANDVLEFVDDAVAKGASVVAGVAARISALFHRADCPYRCQ